MVLFRCRCVSVDGECWWVVLVGVLVDGVGGSGVGG